MSHSVRDPKTGAASIPGGSRAHSDREGPVGQVGLRRSRIEPRGRSDFRWLGAGDEHAFRDLLHATYGDSYSYRELYLPGGLTRLIESGRVRSLGEFGDAGMLVSHTALIFKDPKNGYAESGMSMRRPGARMGDRAGQERSWRELLEQAANRAPFLHQNTTTYHPLAQRYAERLLHAMPVGVILDYAVGEKLQGIEHADAPMHALMMTSALRADAGASKRGSLPSGPWGEWLASIYSRIGLDRDWGRSTVGSSPSPVANPLDEIELNPALGLRRLALRGDLERAIRALKALQESSAPARVDLIHLPLVPSGSWSGSVDRAISLLSSAGYVPVGLRPHAVRPDELVLQRLADRAASVASLQTHSRLGLESAKEMVSAWAALCLRTS